MPTLLPLGGGLGLLLGCAVCTQPRPNLVYQHFTLAVHGLIDHPALTLQNDLPADNVKIQEQRQEPIPADLQDHLDNQEREILVKVLQETRFNRTAAATRLGLSLRQIRYRIARLGIDLPQSSEPNDETA